MTFNTILIPVDFTVNTEVAIQKAVELCDGPNMSIHLLHVPDIIPAGPLDYYRYFARYSFNDSGQQISEVKEKLEYWLTYIKKIRSDVTTFYWISYNISIERAIKEKAKSVGADLIIIGKNSQHSLLPFLNTVVSSRLASRTGISVLTAKPGALSNSLRTVVVPIGSKFPANKVAIINSLGNKFLIHVRLLILLERGDDPDTLQTSLVNICRVLKNRSFNNISYEVLKSDNKAWDILNYSRKVNADLLIVHPESETKIGWLNGHISDELPVNSRTQILAVSQSNLSVI